MQPSNEIRLLRTSIVLLAALMLSAGAGGMAVSYVYLASPSRLDVLAGAAGFIAGSILVASGRRRLALGVPAAVGSDPTVLADALGFMQRGVVDRWLAHFRRNQRNRTEPDWGAPQVLSAEVVRPLVRSLEQFQLGDGGGPACLIAWNAEHLRAGSADTRALVDTWFAEEREHSRLLGAAVARFGGRRIERHWSFTAFCLARWAFGVRFELTVLLLTEIVSTVYYRLMRRHGRDQALCAMCALILRDEAGHVAFHRDRLAWSAWVNYGAGWETRFRALGLAAASMLWINHGHALRALGASRGEFYQEVWRELSRFIRRLRGAAWERQSV
jgi:hypothetical protein